MAILALQAYIAYFGDFVTGRCPPLKGGCRLPGADLACRCCVTNARLLILDDDPQIGKMVQLIAESVGLAARFMTNTAEFFRAVDEWRPTHIAVDLVMPEMDGAEVLVKLADRKCRAKIIITSGVGTRVLDAAGRFANQHGLNISGVLSKPFSPRTLRALLVESTASTDGQTMPTLKALLVEDDADDAEVLARKIKEAGYRLEWTRVETERDFLASLRTPPDIIFSDYSIPQFGGLRVLEVLRSTGLDIPLILVSGTVGEEVAVEAMRYGAADYLLKDRTVRLAAAVKRALSDAQLRAERKLTEAQIRGQLEELQRWREMTLVAETARLAMEEQLRQSHRLDAVGQLTGGVAHDFNNMLTVILGNAELLQESLERDVANRELAAMIVGAANSAAELTKRLLAFARKQALNPIAVDSNQLIAGMYPLLRRTLAANLDIELAAEADVWQALVDPAQLENAVLNLCINARDAMLGGGRLRIETKNVELDNGYAAEQVDVKSGQYVLISVTDTGCGIVPDVLRRVFEPFFTTKDTGKGTGLGLAMVYGFIKQSDGHISIDSEPGQGTTVRMYLPRAVGGAPAAPAAPAATGPSRIIHGTETILLVEDDEQVRRFALSQLKSLGYNVLHAHNGVEAMELIERNEQIDLLFTDVVMPGGISGRQLADAARQRRPGLKVLFTSGYNEDAIFHQGRLDQGVQLLPKPYRRRDLATRIRSIIDAPC